MAAIKETRFWVNSYTSKFLTSELKPGFLNLSIFEILDQIIFVVVVCPVRYRIFLAASLANNTHTHAHTHTHTHTQPKMSWRGRGESEVGGGGGQEAKLFLIEKHLD